MREQWGRENERSKQGGCTQLLHIVLLFLRAFVAFTRRSRGSVREKWGREYERSKRGGSRGRGRRRRVVKRPTTEECCKVCRVLEISVTCTVLEISVTCTVLEISSTCTVLEISGTCTVLEISVTCTVLKISGTILEINVNKQEAEFCR